MSESLKVEIETPTGDAAEKQLQRLSKEMREVAKDAQRMKAAMKDTLQRDRSESSRSVSRSEDTASRYGYQDLIKSDVGKPARSSRVDRLESGRYSTVSMRDVASAARGGASLEAAAMKAAGALGEFGTPLTAAAAAVWELHKASMAAAAEMKAFRSAQLTSGGTSYEVAVGGKIGRYLGLEGKDVAREARQFSERITSDPQAMSYANKYGINDQPGIGGKIDKLEGLLRFVDKLRNVSDTEAIRAARATGTEDFLPLRDLTPRNYEVLKQMARAEGAANSPEALIENANKELGRHVLREGIRDIYHGMGRAFGNDVDAIGRHLIPGMGEAGARSDRELSDFQRRRQGQGSQERVSTALDRTADSLDQLNSYLRQGLYGGGDRARGAVPNAFLFHHGGEYARKQMLATAHSLGAFAL